MPDPVWEISRPTSTSPAVTSADEDESRRAARYRNPDSAQDFLHARCLMRRLAGRTCRCVPCDITLTVFDDAPPRLEGAEAVAVSWSRSGPVALAALLEKGRIGVDVEQIRAIEIRPMLAMIAQPEEADCVLAGQDDTGLRLRFYRLWCAKEALLKWRGTGLRGGAKTVPVPPAFVDGTEDMSSLCLDDTLVTLRALDVAESLVAVMAFSASA